MTALMGLTTVLALARLQVTVPLNSPGVDLVALTKALTAEGVDLIQVRGTRDQKPSTFDPVFGQARSLALPRHTLMVVGRDLEFAARVQADVVHLGASDEPSAQGRAAVAPYGLVGRSVHTEEQLRAGLSDPDVAYLNVGPVYGEGAPGLDLVRLAASLAPPQQPGARPWFAVGGITPELLPEVFTAGAMRVGVGAAVVGAADPAAAAGEFAESLRQLWEITPGMDRVRVAAFRLGHRADPEPGTVDPR